MRTREGDPLFVWERPTCARVEVGDWKWNLER